MEKQTFTVQAKYHFTEEEKKALSQELANKNLKARQIDADKKARMSAFKDQIDCLESEIHLISNNLISGYEFRDFKCFREIDYDRKVRIFKDVMTGDVISEMPIQPEDYQAKMPFMGGENGVAEVDSVAQQ